MKLGGWGRGLSRRTQAKAEEIAELHNRDTESLRKG